MIQIENLIRGVLFLTGLITTPFGLLKYYFQIHIALRIYQIPWYRVLLVGIDLLAVSILLSIVGVRYESQLLLEVVDAYLLGTSIGLVILGVVLRFVDNSLLLLIAQRLNPGNVMLNPFGGVEVHDLIKWRGKPTVLWIEEE